MAAVDESVPAPVLGAALYDRFSSRGEADFDAMAGDGALFTREDAVEAAWAVVDPVLKIHRRARPYKRGSWGPKEADSLIATDGCWHNPKPKEVSG